MSKIYVSVISHGHIDIIKNLDCLNNISNSSRVNVVVKENTLSENESYFKSINVKYINDAKAYGLGFGANNNYVFDYCKSKLGMMDEDIFIVCNPDVHIEQSAITSLVDLMNEKKYHLVAINLFKDFEFDEYDNSIRNFPTLSDFVSSFILKRNLTINDKNCIVTDTNVNWAAGSFLAFRTKHYLRLNGFDVKYFMYCEDIDICFRSYILGVPVVYIPSIKAVHLAKHDNRKILSKHFYWHFTSVIRFLLRKYHYEIRQKTAF